jgi:ABC-2 type transport system permease protein
MRVAIYLKTMAVGFLQVANYRTEVWFQILAKVLVLAGVLLLWSVIGTESTGKTYIQLMAYFLTANGVRELIDAQYGKMGSVMIDDIKNGKISSYLLQPTHTVFYMFAKNMGTRGVTMLFSLLCIVVGIVIVPPVSVWAGLLFLVVVLSGAVICMAQSTMVGCVAFWTTDAKGIKNVVNHITKVFCGSLIPLTFFPVAYQLPVMLNPFATYAYLPATLLQTKTVDLFLLFQVGISIFWAAIFLFFSRMIWKKGVKQYEAIGL